MNKLLLTLLFISTINFVNAQAKGKGKGKSTKKDSVVAAPAYVTPPSDEEIERNLVIESMTLNPKTNFVSWKKNDSLRKVYKARRLSFYVRSKYPPKDLKDGKIQLCYNLIYKDTNIKFCVNDSLCKDPEVAKVLFEKVIGDTNYVLVYIDAFSKSKSNQLCNAGHETKLTLARWNIKTGRAIWKQKSINSCLKTITNMTKTPILEWNKSEPLIVSFHRGTSFIDLKFDPAAPQLGLQSANDAEKKE